MKNPCVLWFILAIFCNVLATSSQRKQCVSSFKNPQHRPSFDICRTKNCLIFRLDAPFIILDGSMKTLEHQRPFLCTEYQKQFSGGLKGAFFDIIREMKSLEDAYCVWAGDHCSFDALLLFLSESAAAGNEHRWIAGGLLFVLEYRISSSSIPSASLVEDELRVVGPPIESYTTALQAFKTIIKPFTCKAWMFIVLCILGHLFIRGCMVYDYVEAVTPVRCFDWKLFRDRLFSIRNYHSEHNCVNRQEQEETLRNRNALWKLIATMFMAITLLFWEVAIAVQVYEARYEANVENIDPERFAVLANSADEYIFKALTGLESGWKRAKSIPETYQILSDPSNNFDSSVQTELTHRYEMNKNPQRCKDLRLYEDVSSELVEHRKPPKISGGWFYSSKVPIAARVEIDKAIARLKEKGRILKIVEDLTGSELMDKCKLKTSRIGWVLLGLLHIMLTGIPSAILIIRILSGGIRRIMRRRLVGEDPDCNGNEETIVSGFPPQPIYPYYVRGKASSRNTSENSSETMQK